MAGYAVRPAVKKRPVVGKAGNYAAPVDTTGMDPAMKTTLTKKPKPRKDALGRLKTVLGI